jgi:hypothetical protein
MAFEVVSREEELASVHAFISAVAVAAKSNNTAAAPATSVARRCT